MKKRKKRWIRITVLGMLALTVAGTVLDQTTELDREVLRDRVLLRLADLTQGAENIETADESITRRRQRPGHYREGGQPCARVWDPDALLGAGVLRRTQH